jgi:hypothetical protein
MRKLTRESISALLTNTRFRKSNMSVEVDGNESRLYLHGNLIARKTGDELLITNAGWRSNTTKERLNALPNVSIYQKQGQWYLNGEKWDGNCAKI